jgi:glycosyltransferase involved in cell wall biosynthesis
LWIGDASCSSGFGRAADQILKILSRMFKCSVIGVNFNGDSKADQPRPYDIYPAWPGRDALGIGRLDDVLPRVKPDVIVMQTNPWHVPLYGKAIYNEGYGKTPLIGIIAVEGKNVQGSQLNGLAKAIFWTEFGRNEALKGGLKKRVPTDIIPLGVDTDVFKPSDRIAARHLLGIEEMVPDDAFIVLNVNRNQTRKRIDLSIIYFAEWITANKIRDAYLYMHVLPGSTAAIDCDQLAKYYGVEDRLILAQPKDIYNGAPEKYVAAAYQGANVYLTTTLGEGFGLTALEAAACELPVIAGNYAALGEWGRNAFWLTECDSEGVMPDVNGMIGAAPSKSAVIQALQYLYENPDGRARWGASSLALAQQPQFNWNNISARFAASIEASCVVPAA